MQLRLILGTTDSDMLDHDDDTGLTNAAYEALMRALSDAGFEVVDGPAPL